MTAGRDASGFDDARAGRETTGARFWSAPFTPARRRGVEILDGPEVPPSVQRRSHRDISVANHLFGGTHAVLAELVPLLSQLPRDITLLDIGTGIGDIPARFARVAQEKGVRVRVVGLDDRPELVQATRDWPAAAVCGNALALPFANQSVDIVCCSQTLHHFVEADAITLIREMNRVGRHRVVIADLRRSWLAAAGLWLFSFPLGFHPVSRHDGVVSVLRGFTARELRHLVRSAVAVVPEVHRRLAYRVTASWTPAAEIR